MLRPWCNGKVRYDDSESAWKIAKQRGKAAYWCGTCDRWHIGGHQGKEKRSQRLKGPKKRRKMQRERKERSRESENTPRTRDWRES